MLAIGALVTGLATVAHAVPTIQADITPQQIRLGEQAQYTLVVADASGGRITFPRFGELTVHGPTQNNQSIFTFTNGVQTTRASRIYTWTITAPKAGTYRIGPATLEHSNQSYGATAVVLRVVSRAPAHRKLTNPEKKESKPGGTEAGASAPSRAGSSAK
jgi:hypothetical protein